MLGWVLKGLPSKENLWRLLVLYSFKYDMVLYGIVELNVPFDTV